jgi:hypothetical protein
MKDQAPIPVEWWNDGTAHDKTAPWWSSTGGCAQDDARQVGQRIRTDETTGGPRKLKERPAATSEVINGRGERMHQIELIETGGASGGKTSRQTFWHLPLSDSWSSLSGSMVEFTTRQLYVHDLYISHHPMIHSPRPLDWTAGLVNNHAVVSKIHKVKSLRSTSYNGFCSTPNARNHQPITDDRCNALVLARVFC